MRSKRIPGRLITLQQPKSPISEAYRTLRTNIQFAGVSRDLHSLLVTSSDPGEGKTTTICNLAVTMAQAGKKVLLIDGDLRKSSVHAAFRLSNSVGLTSLLIRTAEPHEVIHEIPDLSLRVITAGPAPPNPAELLGSRRMQDLLDGFKREYDMVLIDSAPVLAVTDAQVLSQLVEGVLLVLGSGRVPRERVKKAKGLLDRVNAPLVGTVLNRKKLEKGSQYYYYTEQS
ncbi:MAG: CpsD/CapB family tyrosine-protein kinase [Tumebacillaceae bacterium]